MLSVNKLVWIVLLALFVQSCGSDAVQQEVIAKHSGEQKSMNTKGVEETKSILQNGDIILRTGNDVISSLFAQLNKSDKTYSHCGIAMKEDNVWYVYHSIGGEDNPDAKLRKDLFEKFIRSDHNLGYGVCRYPITQIQEQKLEETVHNLYNSKVPFDMKFDLHSDDRLYCAEMVYKAFNIAFDTTKFFTTTVHKGFEYVSTDNIFVNNKASILCHIVY